MALAGVVLSLGTAMVVRGQASSAPTALNDQGTFQISVAGKDIGAETFEIHARNDQVEAQDSVQIKVEQDGKQVDVQTASKLLLGAHLEPLTYTWSQKGAQSSQLRIDFHTKPAQARYKTVSGQDDRREFKLDNDVLVLDDNAIAHYQLAVARYDRTKGGIQTFAAFIPQEALPGAVTLNALGPEAVNLGGASRTLQHFLLATELAQINLWVDDQGRLQLVSEPSAQFQASRIK
jgi:hypothetical protein